MKQIVTSLIIVIALFAMVACSASGSSVPTNTQTQSHSKSTKANSYNKQEKPKKVYGKNEPLPDYDDLVKNPSSYKDAAFLIDGYLYDAEYTNDEYAGHYLNVWITYDYDESQGKYHMNDNHYNESIKANPVEIYLFPRDVFESDSGHREMNYAHIRVSCSLMYVDASDVPVFLYGSGEVL